ncbi:hypothetical protein AOCH_004601 [Aspergillus ochraceoroseus]|uniref:Protein kinase domain-containing protein n=1 Tax=Aspergillus ochraceoroseus TaxID=138278 RepID=A0A0F8X5U5_9EURO|nr:hypothetical protein AOCH_004601 [Aspergillus ochraceoroseus]
MDGIINERCVKFDKKVLEDWVLNHVNYLFYPNGTAKEVYRVRRAKLRELFENILEVCGLRTGLAERIVEQTLAHLSTVLAIVLRVRRAGDNLILQQFINLIICDNAIRATPQLIDENLPIPLADAKSLFPHEATLFYNSQFQFCAVTLKGRQEVIYQDDYRSQCPLPYTEQKRIGGGSFGEVFRVQIARRHFRSTHRHYENTEAEWFARKDFKKKYAFVGELDVLKKIMDQPQKHDHLVMVLAILQYRDTYSLFFPLASCDLHQYLNGEYCGARPDVEEQSTVYKRGVDLAGALAFLHNGFDRVSCLHLDLKPRNVLVYDAGDPDKQTWKITDFGLTRVRDRAARDPARVRDRAARDPDNNEGSTANPAGQGTYRAPECDPTSGRVTTLSDVWSLGCIFSLVITYISEGSGGVRRFAEKRAEWRENNSFYITNRGRTPRISPAVTYWFDHLRSVSKEQERRVVYESLEYLQRKVLHPIRDQRASAKEVELTLLNIYAHFHQQPPPSSPLQQPQPQHSPVYTRFRAWLTRASAKPSYSLLQKLPFNMDRNILGVRISPPEGDFIALFSRQRMDVWSISQIRSSLQTKSEGPQPERKLITGGPVKCFAVSSRFICNCLDGNSFSCYVYDVHGLPGPRFLGEGVKVSYDSFGSIKRVAMSLDGALTAFVIAGKSSGAESYCKIYLAYTQHLIDTASDHSPPHSSRSNSAISESSCLSETIASNLILQEDRVEPASQIRFLNFTANGQFLVMVAQQSTSGFFIRAWETFGGKCYVDFPIPIKVGFDRVVYVSSVLLGTNINFKASPTFRGTLFTACSIYIFKDMPCLVLLTDRRHIIHVNLSRQTLTVRSLDIDLYSMFVCDDDESLILIGKNRGLWAYLLPLSAIDKSDAIRIAKINHISYVPDPDDAAVRRNADGQLELIIANASGMFLDMGIPDVE